MRRMEPAAPPTRRAASCPSGNFQGQRPRMTEIESGRASFRYKQCGLVPPIAIRENSDARDRADKDKGTAPDDGRATPR